MSSHYSSHQRTWSDRCQISSRLLKIKIYIISLKFFLVPSSIEPPDFLPFLSPEMPWNFWLLPREDERLTLSAFVNGADPFLAWACGFPFCDKQILNYPSFSILAKTWCSISFWKKRPSSAKRAHSQTKS